MIFLGSDDASGAGSETTAGTAVEGFDDMAEEGEEKEREKEERGRGGGSWRAEESVGGGRASKSYDLHWLPTTRFWRVRKGRPFAVEKPSRPWTWSGELLGASQRRWDPSKTRHERAGAHFRHRNLVSA